MSKFVKWLLAVIFAGIALLALLFAIKKLAPEILGSKEVSEEGGSVDTDFPVVVRMKGGMLEVASITGTRVFNKATDPAFFGQRITYCREKASWRAPYKITYRLKLGDKWPLRYNKGTLIARVPELEPSLPVAFQSSAMRSGPVESCRFIPDQGTRDRALKSISPELEKLAKSKKAKDFARESARKTVTEFLRTWVFNQTAYPDLPPDAQIKVIFPGE